MIIALALGAVLSAVAVLHAYWALGGLWPARNAAELSRMVIGEDLQKMPGTVLTLVVAGLILVAGMLPIASVNAWPGWVPIWLHTSAMLGAALVFLVRGAVSYTPWAMRLHTVEPFATLNRRYFSPLCLALGVGFLVVLLG